MTSATLPYGKAGDDDRRIRVFISHRFEADKTLYDEVLAKLKSQGHGIEDMSLNVERLVKGPQGGRRPILEVKAQIAARIHTSDILLAPARPATTRSQRLSWEIELASVGYGLPVLFIKEPDIDYSTRFVTEIQGLELSHAIAERRPEDIIQKMLKLIGGRPTWDMRFDEQAPNRKFRGPPPEQLTKVMALHPFQSRLGG